MLAVDATQRGAAGARLALVACAPGWIAEIIAPGPLQYIAAERRHVANLRAGSEIEGLGDDRVIVPYLRMLAGGGHRDESAEIEPVDATFDAGPRRVERIDVDQYLGPHHVELHQVEEGRAAGQVLRRRHRRRQTPSVVARRRLHRFGETVGALVEEGTHSSAPHLALGLVDRLDDVRIGRASAEIAAHMFADLGVAPGMPFSDAADRRDDLPRRAVAALECVLIDEGLLHRVQRAPLLGKPLDCRHRATHRDGEGQAAEDARAVDQHRASSALAVVAALLRPGEAEMLAQRIEQRRARVGR